MAVDPNETRRQRVFNAFLDGATRTWTRGNGQNQVSVTISNVVLRELNGIRVLSADVTVTRGGTVWFDDRVNMPNPANSVVSGLSGGNPVLTDNPLAAARQQLEDTVIASTKSFTRPWVQRTGPSSFLGDTLSVRSGSADGVIESSNATWSTAQSGSGLSADTTTTNPFILAGDFGLTYDISTYYSLFDTSSIDDAATVSDFTFTLYATGSTEADGNNHDLQARIKDWGGTLTTADWIDYTTAANWTGLTLMGTFDIGAWNQTNNTANNFTSTANVSGINKTGTTYIVVNTSGVTGAAPAGENRVRFYTTDVAGTTSDPLLVVNYTVATPVTGTMASTLQKATFSGTGAQTQTGTIASTLKAATASLTGAQTQTGTVASTMQAATFSGSGTHSDGFTGTIASTLQPATSTLSGFMVPSGSMASTMRPPTATLVGVMQPSGVMAVTTQAALFNGTGSQAVTGSMAAALEAALFSGTGAQVLTGSMVATLQAALFSGVGVFTYPNSSSVLIDLHAHGSVLLDAHAFNALLADSAPHSAAMTDQQAHSSELVDAHAHGGKLIDE